MTKKVVKVARGTDACGVQCVLLVIGNQHIPLDPSHATDIGEALKAAARDVQKVQVQLELSGVKPN